jgi:carboxypeptidase family protein
MRMILLAALTAALSFWQATPPSPPSPGTLALTGRVVTGREADLRPVRRAKVTLTASSGPARVTDTDTKGVYRFDRLPAADYKVSVQKPGFVKLDGAASPDATLTLVRGGAIEGTVADAACRRAITRCKGSVRRHPTIAAE